MRPRHLLLLTLIPVLALAACSDDPAAPPGPAVRLVFEQVPAVVVADSPFTVTVHAARADGSVDDAFTDPITISLASGSGTLNGTTTLAATAGKATFTGLTLDQEGAFTLGAAAGDLTAATSASITSSPEPPMVRSGTFSGQNGYVCMGSVEVIIPANEGTETLRTGSDFTVSSGGGSISIWLTDAAGAGRLGDTAVKVKLGTILTGFAGVYSYAVPEGGSSRYTHVVAYCDGARVNFGNSALSAPQ